MPQIKCVMFDLINVFVAMDSRKFPEELSKYAPSWDRAPFISGSRKETAHQYELGHIGDIEFAEKMAESIGADIDPITFLNLYCKFLESDAFMVKMRLKCNAAGLKTVLVTNLGPAHHNHIRRNFPEALINFDTSMISYLEHVRKPMPEIWLKPMRKLGVGPEECLFIDDSPGNVEAFTQLGGEGFHYRVVDPHTYFHDYKKLKSEKKRFEKRINEIIKGKK